TLATIEVAGDRFERCGDAGALTARLEFSLDKIRDLRYGENPHQQAAWYCGPIKSAAAGLGQAAILQGKELSYTNLLDLDAGARPRHRGAPAVDPQPARLRVARRHETAADRPRVGGASVCLAHLRARQIEYGRLHRRAADAGNRRGPDEPHRCRERGGDESA